MYFSDNDGNLLCVDINTLMVVWARDVKDDADATMVLDETSDGVFLYHGNEIDRRGTRDTQSNLRKINALTGQIVWQHDVSTTYNAGSNGGVLGSPILGRNDSRDLVFFNVARTDGGNAGRLLALNRDTGKPQWERRLPAYSWSSPLIFTSTEGTSYGLLCDSAGVMHLFDPRTGQDHDTVNIEGNCESSPAMFNDTAVVATRAGKIFAVKVR